MTLSSNPAPARSDLTGADPTTQARPARGRHPFVAHGALLSAGALAWSACILAFGVDPVGNPTELLLFGLGSGLFQIGLLALLRVLWRTRALGAGRIARSALIGESILVSFAIGSTLADAFSLSDLSQPAWAALDAFWPLSMLGMVGIGIRVAIAGRWTGVTRFWPLVAESWAVVVLPINGILGGGVARYVAAAHLVVGYAVLGVLVARKTA